MPLPTISTPPQDLSRWSAWWDIHISDHLEIQQALARQGSIATLAVLSGGSGYINGETLIFTFKGASGTGASATGTVVGTAVSTVDLASGGQGFAATPTVIATGDESGADNATFTVTMSASLANNLSVYVMTPWNTKDADGILGRHQEAHDDFNQALGLNGQDLSALNPKDPNDIQRWVWQNAAEHAAARQALGI
jgi:hypothetical protein